MSQIENTKQDNCQKTTHRHIIFRLQKIKDKVKILKEARQENSLTYREIKMRIIFNLLETMQTGEWSEIFKVLREKKNHQPKFCILQNHFKKV